MTFREGWSDCRPTLARGRQPGAGAPGNCSPVGPQGPQKLKHPHPYWPMVLGLPVMQLPGDWRTSPTHSSTWGHPLDRDLVGQVYRYHITCKMGAPAPQELYTVHLYGLAALGPSFGGFRGPQLTAHGLAPAPIYCVTLGWLLYFSELWTLYSQ